jgi:hypothetical protein
LNRYAENTEERRPEAAATKPSRVLFSSPATPAVRSTSGGGLGGAVDHGLSDREFLFFIYIFSVLLGMVRRRLHSDIRIRPSSSYPRCGVASSVDGERMKSCA